MWLDDLSYLFLSVLFCCAFTCHGITSTCRIKKFFVLLLLHCFALDHRLTETESLNFICDLLRMRKHTQVREKNLPCSESLHDRGQQDNETSKMKARCWGSWFTTTYSWSSLQAPLLPDLFRMCSRHLFFGKALHRCGRIRRCPACRTCIAAKLLNVLLLQKLLPIEIPTT